MAREIPEVVRAVAGLAATVLDEARKLPETLPGLPVRLIGQALQTSLKLQQQYSGLVARGDELFTGLRGAAEPGMATFDDDEDLPASAAGPVRDSAFDLVETPADTVAEELAEDLAVSDLPVVDPDDLSDQVSAAVLIETLAADADDMSPAEVAALPDDPAADAVTAVVDELAAEVADEVVEQVPDAVPDEVLEDLTADLTADVAEDESAVEEAAVEEAAVEEAAVEEAAVLEALVEAAEEVAVIEAVEEAALEDATVEEAAIAEAVADAQIADAAVGGTPPVEEAAEVPTLDDVLPDQAPEQTQVVDDVIPDLAALADSEEELVDLGGPEAAESVTPGSPVTDSAASEPLVAPEQPAEADTPEGDTPEGDTPEGDTAEGDTAEGDTAEGDTPEATTEGDTASEQPTAADTAETGTAAEQPAEGVIGTAAPDTADTGPDTGSADAPPSPTSPVEGYDTFSIPALRGHLRAYPAETVADLLDYERATRARAPYVTLLQNRLEKLSADRG